MRQIHFSGRDDMKNFKEFVLDKLKLILIALVISLVVDKLLFGFAIVDGQSMYPTLSSSDRILILKIPYIAKNPSIGDIIIFNPPKEEEGRELFIKRVIAKAGDTFKIMEGHLYVNDTLVSEAYINKGAFTDRGYRLIEGTVPEDTVFVLGDNRNDSNDSRSFGFVDAKHIKGKALLRIWPIKEITVFVNPY